MNPACLLVTGEQSACCKRLYSGQKMARNTQLAANWIGDSDCFWYCRETRAGCEYRIVDARALSNLPAFDHDRLAIALQQASRQTVNASTLALSALEFDLRQQVVSFDALGGRWKFESNKSLCTRFVSPRRDWVLSPDRQLAAFVRDENLWIYDCPHRQRAGNSLSTAVRIGFMPALRLALGLALRWWICCGLRIRKRY